MHNTMPPLPFPRRKHARQRGVALFVVIVFVMLSMLLALWASRTSFFNEMLVGNDADYQRAFEAAQALLQDAELDIRGQNPDGTSCTGTLDVCRTTTIDKIPLDATDVTPLLAELDTQPTKCRSGLCTKRAGRQDFWNYASTSVPSTPAAADGEISLEEMTETVSGVSVGARYGQYTGAIPGDPSAASTTANPILADTSAATRGGWYWIEVLPYDESSKNSGLIVDNTTGAATTSLLALNLRPSVAYRITALAYGRKPSTMVVLQQSYVRQVLKD